MKLDEEDVNRRANSRLEMQRRNEAYDKKVALAARAITRDRDMEKDKLTKIGIEKKTAELDKKFMQQHLQQEVAKNQTT